MVGSIHSTLAGWRPSVHGWFDSAATASSSSSASSSATARANAEIMSTHIDLVGRPIEWGSNTERRDESGHCWFGTGPPTMHANAGRRLSTSAAAAHVIGSASAHWRRAYSSSEEREHEHGHIRKELLSSASCRFLERGLSSPPLPGSVSIMGCRFGDVTHRANHCATHVDHSRECSHKCWEWKYAALGFLALAETPRSHSAAVPQDGHDEERNRDGISLETRSRNSVPSITATGTARSIVVYDQRRRAPPANTTSRPL